MTLAHISHLGVRGGTGRVYVCQVCQVCRVSQEGRKTGRSRSNPGCVASYTSHSISIHVVKVLPKADADSGNEVIVVVLRCSRASCVLRFVSSPANQELFSKNQYGVFSIISTSTSISTSNINSSSSSSGRSRKGSNSNNSISLSLSLSISNGDNDVFSIEPILIPEFPAKVT